MYSLCPAVARGGRVAVRADHDVAALHDVSVEQHAVLDVRLLLHLFHTGETAIVSF